MREVEAVKTESQRIQIESLLSQRNPIYRDIWKFLLNTALRISDVLSISMEDMRLLDNDHPCLKIIEQKTGKRRSIVLNTEALSIIRRRQEKHPNDVWLFQSTSNKLHRDFPKPINRRSVGRVLEAIGSQITPKVQLGCHSGRKTRGYLLFSEKNYPIEKISRILNHHSTSVTMAYIGITQTDIDNSYTELVL